jgi:hypothetical protein
MGNIAAGGGRAGGFDFLEEAVAAEAAGGFSIGGGHGNNVRQFGAPAAFLLLAGHRCVALGAAGLHGEIMARSASRVQRRKIWGRGASGFLVSRAKRVLSWIFAGGSRMRVFTQSGAGLVYFMLLQSLTGNSNS